MTVKEAKHMSEILKAWADGKTIQFKGESGWDNLKNPIFIASPEKYRIKPSRKIRPYKTLDEFLKDKRKHGPMVWFNTTVFGTPLDCVLLDDTVVVSFNIPAHSTLNANDLVKYRWEDGSPCGVIEDDLQN